MSHDDLDTVEVLDEGEFSDESQPVVVEDSEKIILNKKPRRGIRRLIEDVLEEQRLRATLKGFDESLNEANQ